MSNDGNTHGTYPYIDAGTLEACLDDPDFFEYAIVFYDTCDEEYSVSAITSTWEDANTLAQSEQSRGTEAYVVKVQDALYGDLFA